MYRLVATKSDLQNLSVVSGTLVDCKELKTTYKFNQVASGYTVNDVTVIQSSVVLTGKWIGIAGRNVYDPTADSGGSVKSNKSSRPTDFTGVTLSQLRARSSFEGETVYCKELKTTYQYFSNFSNVAVDGTAVIDSTVSPSARWVAVSGKFTYVSVENYYIHGSPGDSLIAPPYNITLPTSVSSQLQNPILVFYQEFPKGAGYTGSYTLTGIDNGSLSAPFATGQIVTAKPVTVVFPDGKAVYDNLFPRTSSHRITASVDMSGLVTLSAPPYSGYSQPIRIYFFYSLASNEILYSYVRDDIVTDIESAVTLFSTEVNMENTLSLLPGSVTTLEDAINHLQTQINSLGGAIATREKFTTTLGQTVFNLLHTPVSIYDGFEVEFRGTELVEGDDFTVSGSTVTLVPGWGSIIQAGDKIVISYKY